MAIGQNDLDLLRNEFEAKLANANLQNMKAATAISAYGERFTGLEARMDAFEFRLDALSQDMERRFQEVDRRFQEVDRRFDAVEERIELLAADVDRRLTRLESRMDSLESKLDARFGWQTVMFAALGLLVLFAEPLRAALGL